MPFFHRPWLTARKWHDCGACSQVSRPAPRRGGCRQPYLAFAFMYRARSTNAAHGRCSQLREYCSRAREVMRRELPRLVYANPSLRVDVEHSNVEPAHATVDVIYGTCIAHCA